MSQYDFVAIGDIVTDAFIKLVDAEVHKHAREVERELCMPFAAKIPYEDVIVVPAVGNCANAAVAAARLSLKSALLTNQGDDEIGRKNLEVLKNEKVGTEFVFSHQGPPSNYHYVLLFHAERTILVKHHSYPYKMPDIGEPKWLYVTSLGEAAADFHQEIEKYLDEHPKINLVWQPGTFQIKLGQKLSGIYKRARFFFSNVEEAQRILVTTDRDIRKLSERIAALGPKIVCLTDGTAGAYAFDAEKGELWFIPPYPDPKPIVDRTGAGDAFSATFTVAIALGKSIPEALSWGPINSMSVVQYVGAREGLLSREKIEEYLGQAPVEYKPKLFSNPQG